jgi:hypothetical protein
MRMEGKTYDSFKPAPIGEWAKWTYHESDRDGLRRARWMPPQLHQEGQKSGIEPLAGVLGHLEGDTLLLGLPNGGDVRRNQARA